MREIGGKDFAANFEIRQNPLAQKKMISLAETFFSARFTFSDSHSVY
jgi:hypothetical protein